MSFLFRLDLLTDHELSTMNSPPRPPSSWKELLAPAGLVFSGLATQAMEASFLKAKRLCERPSAPLARLMIAEGV